MLLFICSTWSVRLGKGLSGHFSLCWWKCQVRGDGAWPQRWWNTFSSSTCSSSLTVSTENWLNVFNKKTERGERQSFVADVMTKWNVTDLSKFNLTISHCLFPKSLPLLGPPLVHRKMSTPPPKKNTNFVFWLTYFTYFKYNCFFCSLYLSILC